jgi:hypothetical protein
VISVMHNSDMVRVTPAAICLACAVALAAGASAQEPAKPLPPVDAPTEPQQPTSPQSGVVAPPVEGLERTPAWSSSLGLTAGYDSNVDLLPGDEGSGDASGRLDASVKRRFSREGFRAEFEANAGALAYKELDEFNALPFGGRFEADGTGDTGTRAVAALEYRHDYLRNSASFVEAGLVRYNVLASTASASLDIAERTTNRSGFVAGASYRAISYQDDVQPAGNTLSLGGGWAWRPSENDQLSVRYLFKRERSDGYPGSNNHDVRLTWERRLTAKLQLSAFGGVGRAETLADGEVRTSPSGGLRLDGRQGRHELGANYEYSFGQAYGLGRSLLFNGIALYEGYSLTPRWSVYVRGSLSRGRDPLDPSYVLDGEGVTAFLSHRVTPRCTLRASYSYWTRRETGVADYGSNVLELKLLYQLESRKTITTGR